MVETRSVAMGASGNSSNYVTEDSLRAEIDAVLESRFDDMLSKFQEQLETTLQIFMGKSKERHQEAPNTSGFSGLTKFGRIEFPRFNGSEVEDWIFRAEQFFELNHVEEQDKVRIASMHYEGLAGRWHRTFNHSFSGRNLCKSWSCYTAELINRFGEGEASPGKNNQELEETHIIATTGNQIQDYDALEGKRVSDEIENPKSTCKEELMGTSISIQIDDSKSMESLLDVTKSIQQVEPNSTKGHGTIDAFKDDQVLNLQLKPSLSLIKERWVDYDNGVLMGMIRRDALIKGKRKTHYMFDIWSLRTKDFRDQKPRLSRKCWKFKFKKKSVKVYPKKFMFCIARRMNLVPIVLSNDDVGSSDNMSDVGGSERIFGFYRLSPAASLQMKIKGEHSLSTTAVSGTEEFSLRELQSKDKGRQFGEVNGKLFQNVTKVSILGLLSRKTKFISEKELGDSVKRKGRKKRAVASTRSDRLKLVGEGELKQYKDTGHNNSFQGFKTNLIASRLSHELVEDAKLKRNVLRVDFSHFHQLIQDLKVPISYFDQQLWNILVGLIVENKKFVTGNIVASRFFSCKVSDELMLGESHIQRVRKGSKCSKSWKFKFKIKVKGFRDDSKSETSMLDEVEKGMQGETHQHRSNSKSPSFLSTVCLCKIAKIARETATLLRVLEKRLSAFGNGDYWFQHKCIVYRFEDVVEPDFVQKKYLTHKGQATVTVKMAEGSQRLKMIFSYGSLPRPPEINWSCSSETLRTRFLEEGRFVAGFMWYPSTLCTCQTYHKDSNRVRGFKDSMSKRGFSGISRLRHVYGLDYFFPINKYGKLSLSSRGFQLH